MHSRPTGSRWRSPPAARGRGAAEGGRRPEKIEAPAQLAMALRRVKAAAGDLSFEMMHRNLLKRTVISIPKTTLADLTIASGCAGSPWKHFLLACDVRQRAILARWEDAVWRVNEAQRAAR